MKKRCLAAALILAVIAGTFLVGKNLMNHMIDGVTAQLDVLAQSAANEDWPQAEQAARAARAALRSRQTILSLFVAHSQLSDLDETLSALPIQAQNQDEEVAVEIEKARSQLRALSALFFRTL